MKAIITKQEIVYPQKSGFVTGDRDKLIIIKLFSIPIFQKKITYQV